MSGIVLKAEYTFIRSHTFPQGLCRLELVSVCSSLSLSLSFIACLFCDTLCLSDTPQQLPSTSATGKAYTACLPLLGSVPLWGSVTPWTERCQGDLSANWLSERSLLLSESSLHSQCLESQDFRPWYSESRNSVICPHLIKFRGTNSRSSNLEKTDL